MSGGFPEKRDLVARAFAFRRALRSASIGAERPGFEEGCDALLLSLVLDLAACGTVRVVDPVLASALAEPLGDRGAVMVAEGRSADLTLLPFAAIGRPGVPLAGTVLVHDVPRAIPLAAAADGTDLALVALNQVSAATWRSRLALAGPSHDPTSAMGLLERLRDALRAEELDPLFLLEALNRLRGDSNGGDLPEDAAGDRARCRTLERRVRELETSGLVRYQALLADAALRRKYGP